MADDQVNVKISADASGVAPGVQTAKTEVESLGTTTKSAASQMKEAFTGVTLSVREMGIQVRENIEAVGEFREMLAGFAELMIAAFAIEKVADFAKEIGEAAEQTVHLAETFGMTVGQVQQLGGVAKATGISLDTITRGMAALDRTMINAEHANNTAANALKAVGISANDGRNQMDKLLAVADKFKEMDDGPKKVALAMALFGKSGKELIPILDMGREGIEKINEKTKEYGVVNEAAVAKGLELAESMNENSLAMAGLSNVMTDAFAPMFKAAVDNVNELIKAFVESYNKGGAAKVTLEIIAGTCEVLGQALYAVGEVVVDLWNTFVSVLADIASICGITFKKDAPEATETTIGVFNDLIDIIVLLKDECQITFALIAGTVHELAINVDTACKVMDDAFHLNWSSIEADWAAGTKAIADNTIAEANRVNTALAQEQKAIAAFAKDKNVFGGGELPEHLELPKVGGDGDLGFHGGGGHKTKPKGPSVSDQWKTELANMLADEKNWGADEAALSLQFWEGKLGLVKKGSKDELEVQREIARAKIALFKENQTQEIAGIKQLEALKLEASRSDIELSKIALDQKLADIDDAEARGAITALKAVEARAAVNKQLYQLDLDLEDREFAAKREALQNELALEHLKPQQIAEINRQIEMLDKQHLDKEAQLKAQASAKELADERKVMAERNRNMQGMANSWATALSRMATLQAGFMSTVKSMWQGLVGMIAQVLQEIIAKWIIAQLTKIGLIKAEHAATVQSEASMAGAGGVASMAAAPFPINLGAPGFGAAMAAAAMSFGALGFSAEGGYDVPGGAGPGIDGRGGQIGVVHPREMVLPADIADNFRNGGGGGARITIHATDAKSVQRLFMDNKHHLAKAITQYARDGGR
jgi:hypothetical protein